jgi:hypothetical protein
MLFAKENYYNQAVNLQGIIQGYYVNPNQAQAAA